MFHHINHIILKQKSRFLYQIHVKRKENLSKNMRSMYISSLKTSSSAFESETLNLVSDTEKRWQASLLWKTSHSILLFLNASHKVWHVSESWEVFSNDGWEKLRTKLNSSLLLYSIVSFLTFRDKDCCAYKVEKV